MTKPKGDFIASESQFVSNKKLVETQGLPWKKVHHLLANWVSSEL